MANEGFHADHERYEQSEDEPQTPGEVLMWFGKFEGTRLDQLTDNYRWTIYRLGREKPNAMFREFREIHDLYTAWLDERRSPLSTKVWFGKHQGHEIRVLYNAPRRWRWLVRNTVWGPELASIEQRFTAWRAKHPRRNPAPRARPVILNPVGEKLGLYDDRAASDNDEPYDTDGGFIVSDGEMEDSDWDEEEEEVEIFTDGEKSDDETTTLQDEDEEQNEQQHEEIARTPSIRDVDSDSDDSLPSVAEIVRRSATKKTPQLKQRFQPYPNSTPSRATRQRYIVSSDDDDDEDDDTPMFTPFISTGKIKKTGGLLRRPSKNSQSTVIVLSSDSETGQQPPTSRKNRGHKTPFQNANTAPIDSDDEPLVPKLLREKLTEASAKTPRR
ncbi:hypothetical protein F4806DRAFT_507621 [Annulohypoxylon nitens]|nr:hypothetical protein F4806DRAFT_507621 [Annulohypoxylon nitens]